MSRSENFLKIKSTKILKKFGFNLTNGGIEEWISAIN